MSSSSATLTTWLRHQRMPAMGAVIGRASSRSMINIQTGSRHNRCLAGPLQFEANVDKVIWRPRSRVAERQFALVLLGDFLDPGVEQLRLFALHEKGGVQNHLV